MKENFVTIINYNFIPQVLALYNSMNEHISEFTLWIICVDHLTKDFFVSKKYKNIQILSLDKLETEELKSLRKSRTLGEYIWTLTPFLPDWVFENDKTISRLTFLDADTFFLKNPIQIYKEYENINKPILITKHNYDPIYDQSEKSGIYCVQFIIFNRLKGIEVRNSWKKECLRWCFNKFEDGKFGDQKYLDKWPNKFGNHVHVLTQDDAFQAPWNARVYDYSKAIVWHFQGFRIVNRGKFIYFGNYNVPKNVVENIYKKYLKIIKENLKLLEHDISQNSNITMINKIKSLVKFYLLYFKILRR